MYLYLSKILNALFLTIYELHRVRVPRKIRIMPKYRLRVCRHLGMVLFNAGSYF